MSLFENEEDVDATPKGNQGTIIETDAFPMRVLAGAGTGKTFTMVRKIERLLQTEQAAPRDILALTFTNKAADSMRGKLNARIGADGYDIDAYTYHSICHSILRDYPYYADLSSAFTIATDADKFELAEAAVEAVSYRFVDPGGSYRDTPADVLLGFVTSMKQEGVEPAELDDYLPAPSVLIELDEMTDRIESAARKHLRRQSLGPDGVDGFCSDLDTFKLELQLEQQSLGTSPLEEDVNAYIQQLIGTVDRSKTMVRNETDALTTGSKQTAVRLPAVLFSGYGTEGEQMTSKRDFPSGIPELPFTLLDRLRAFFEDCKRAHDFLPGYQEYERVRQRDDLADFDDLIQATVDLLQREELAAEIAGQWDYVFCDEFQDTDSIQFELVTTLAEHTNLFIVGDDDQAIYEWRGAESENIGQKLTETYQSELTDMELELNFRSKQPILDLANNAITALEGRGSTKELTAYGPDREATDGVAYIDTTPPDTEDPPDDDEFQAAQVTTTVGGLLRGDLEPIDQQYQLNDIAILVRKNRHAQPLIEAFGEAGIPYELVGDISTESVGVETVVAYLRALATPSDDVSVRRVLLMRYRVNEADLRHLAGAAESLMAAVRSIDLDELTEPDSVATARQHFEQLLSRRTALPVELLYHELLETTDIEWLLTRTERRELKGLEEVIADYGDPAVQPSIDHGFIDYLDRHETIVEATDSRPTDQADTASQAVSIMTIHQAKGLDFPVVILPNLTADEWAPQRRQYSELISAVDGTGFWEADYVKRDHQEARRLLHVGITRAEEQLVLCGQPTETTRNDEGLTLDDFQPWIADGINWDVTAGSFPVWKQIQSSLPASVQNWTDMVTEDSPRRSDGVATYAGELLDYEEAIAAILDQADRFLADDLDGVEPVPIEIPSDAFSAIPEPSLRRRHSYTSLGNVDECARKHYLNHVVYGYELPHELRASLTGQSFNQARPSVTTGTSGGEASNREVGVLFHETAEAAIDRNRTGKGEWETICKQLAQQRGFEHAVDGALECIERFFQTPVPEWELLSAEHPFGIEIDGDYVVGEIDCLARQPDGELVVLDYKATGSTKAATNRQLPLYILACDELFQESIRTAGYVYVGDVGPELDLRTYDDARLANAKDRIREGLAAAAVSSYTEYTAGEHCQWCPHNELPCSDLHAE